MEYCEIRNAIFIKIIIHGDLAKKKEIFRLSLFNKFKELIKNMLWIYR